MNLRIIILLFGIFCLNPVFAGKIKKAMAVLDIYNYFEAKRLFEKAEKKEVVAASYGLSIIYQRTDNPFSNLDSSYAKIQRAVEGYPKLKAKKKLKYKTYGIDSIVILNQRNLISDLLYKRALIRNSISAFDVFAKTNPWSRHRDEAIYKRDSIAFELAVIHGKAKGYEQFLVDYPNSEFSKAAKSSFDKLLYVENTASNNFVDYLTFLDKYPASPYRPDAEDKIYEISTRAGTSDAYAKFIEDFPTNRNVKNAWKKLFNVHLQGDYSLNSLNEFKDRFPEYPFSKELEKQLEMADIELLPVKIGDLWGYIDISMRYEIPMEYQEVNHFKEGLAVVKKGEWYGYLDKTGEMVIDPIFHDAMDFNEGHAVVEVNDYLGMINRNGEYIVQPAYEDLGNLENGLAYFQNEDELYGYFDEKGLVRLKAQYTDAYDFEDGLAIVSKNDYYGLIDPFGTTYMAFKYDDLRRYSRNVFKAKLRDNWGLVSLKGDTIVPFLYDYIGEMIDGRAIVERGGEFNYIDSSGKVLLAKWIQNYSEFKELAKFKNGYAKLKYDKSYNLIDTTGKRIYPRNQANLGEYGNLIAVKKGQHWGYLTPKGNTAIPNSFSMARSFEGDFGIAGSEPLWGLINKKGKYIIEPYFEKLDFLNDSLLLAKSRSSYGILNTQGDTLLKFTYISIEPINDSVVELERGGELFYYNLSTQAFIRTGPKE